MTLPSGAISMSQVNTEIGSPTSTARTLNDTIVRRLAQGTAPPTSPFLTSGSNISMDDLRGKTASIKASGGTSIDSGGYRIHTFTSPGTFTVNYVFPSADTVEYLVVAGGGGGGFGGSPLGGGGGGAGGYRTGTGLPITATSYTITVGGGGPAGASPGGAGGSGIVIIRYQI